MNKTWDLVVAGAGPAGCALAAKVADAGYDVLLLERSKAPAEGRSWIVDVERTVFSEAGVPEPSSEASWYEPEEQVMMSDDGDVIKLKRSPVVPVKNREYVLQLADWAMESGVELLTGTTVLGPVFDGERVSGITFLRREKVERAESRLVADCTGLAATIRRSTPTGWCMNGRVARQDVVLARREVRRVDRQAAGEAVESGALVDRKRVDRMAVMAPYSVFTYYLDLERGQIDILVGGKLGGRYPTADEWFSRILARWPFVGEPLFGDGAAIPVRRTWDSLVGEGLLLAGDAACQVIPIHGSGTASALIAADMASRSVAGALESGRDGRAGLWDYCHDFQSGRGAVLAYYYAVQRHTDSLDPSSVSEMIRKGVISARDVHNGLLPAPFEKNPVDLARKVARGASSIPLLMGFAVAGLRAERMMRHYRRYPEKFDEESLLEWRKRTPSV